MSTIEILVIAVLVGAVIGLGGEVWIDRAEKKYLKEQIEIRDMAITSGYNRIRGLEEDTAQLVGELSQVKNTLALAIAEAAKDSRQPVKAKTAAEVRSAVERRNLEESESDG